MHHWKRWIGTGLQEYDDNNPMLQSIYFHDKRKYTKSSFTSKLPLACKASAKNSSKGSASLREDLSWSWKVVKIPAIFVSTFQLSLHTTCENTCQGYGSKNGYQHQWPENQVHSDISYQVLHPCWDQDMTMAGFFRSRLSPYFTALKGMENASGEAFSKLHIDECRWISVNFWQSYKFMYNAWKSQHLSLPSYPPAMTVVMKSWTVRMLKTFRINPLRTATSWIPASSCSPGPAALDSIDWYRLPRLLHNYHNTDALKGQDLV